MKKFLILSLFLSVVCFQAIAQPATYSVPVSIGRNNCGTSGVLDSVYFFNYAGSAMSNNTSPRGCKPVLNPRPFTINIASISFNPRDQKIYYIWTDLMPSPPKSYIWRWDPLTCPVAPGLDTVRTFNYDIGGITFDPNGYAWQLEFSGVRPYKAYLRRLDFVTGVVNSADTLDLIPTSTGMGDTLFNVNSGDITMTPSGQMYFVFDNKLYTPDYGSWNNPTHHIKATCIDSIRRPTGATNLVGLSFADGDLIAGYISGCTYRKIDPITGDTAGMIYTYPIGKGVRSSDMTQINSGLGVSKKVISVIPTGSPNQYDVVYEIYVRNYGNVPITNVQISDNLASVNGLGNVSNVSAMFASNPAGFILNPAYNGTTITDLLIPDTLFNYPVPINNFTVRLSARFSNILSGVLYNNSAIGTANGFNNVALRDSSTNGNNPDLNQNDKPDDIGEGQPTPFLISVAATTPACATLEQTLYTQNFGNGGPGLLSSLPATPTATTGYIGTNIPPVPIKKFTVTRNAIGGDPDNWISLTDRSGSPSGRLMAVNADGSATLIYTDTLPVSCGGQQYSLSFWAANLANTAYSTTCNAFGGLVFPKILIRIRDLTTGVVITQVQTNDITSNTWQQFGMKWIQPAGFTNLILELINAAPGGCGNDFAIDDIMYGLCDPLPRITTSGIMGCIGGSSTFNSNVTDIAVIPGAKDYQWQVANVLAGPYINIPGATSASYVINPVAASDTGKYYRLIVAAAGNMGISACQYLSDTLRLTGRAPSVVPATATANKNNICAGISVNLGITGGTLGTGATWRWYTGSCGGTLVGSGATITVTPAVTTTYYVRAEGDCNTSACATVTVTIVCDIDKDNDGIPDYVESYMPAALLDTDGDGISNAFDTDYAGFIDYNNDYINDNFQGDGDSDNDGIINAQDATFAGRTDVNADNIDDRFDMDLDGIINMLDLDSDNDGITDVAEAVGVDTNGNGVIDNYTDTDNDGLSQNVDGNNTGARISGVGLGAINFDGDANANAIDRDSDNDGIPDVIEISGTDSNNDGIIDGFTDANLDGISDAYINGTALLITGTDINSDGRADTYPNKNFDNDKRPDAYDLDSDMDGIVDVIEAGFADTDFNGFIDGPAGTDGWNISVNAAASLILRNTDGRGRPDWRDIDADDDGIPDNVEGQTTIGYQFAVNLDNDSDGLDNTYDIIVGYGGRGVFLSDKDMDGIPDYIDLDTDADGQPDITEGNDFNFNGIGSDDVVALTLLDTDGDGLDNRFDSLNSITNIKGTSYRMGNGGTFAGDATPGSRTVVQMTGVAMDRDWRSVGIVLNVQLLNFKAIALNNTANLEWSIISSVQISRFEIERSLDNVKFDKIGTVSETVNQNSLQYFTSKDNLSSLHSEYIYYRVKVVAVNGSSMYTNIAIIKRTQSAIMPVMIFPNPSQDKFTVRFSAEKDGDAYLRLFDKTGRQVLMRKVYARKGVNEALIDNLLQYAAGVYSLQFTQSDKSTTIKVVIQHGM